MPSDLVLKTMNTVHRTLLAISGQRVGWSVSKMPVLELTTTGRKSGRAHTVMLTAPLTEGDALIVVASRGGDDRAPAWFLNLRDNPDVEVALRGKPKQRMTARVAGADERTRLWPRITADHRNYATYQTKTSREIPLVFLEPSS